MSTHSKKTIEFYLGDCESRIRKYYDYKLVDIVTTWPLCSVGVDCGNGAYDDTQPESGIPTMDERVGIEIKECLKMMAHFSSILARNTRPRQHVLPLLNKIKTGLKK